MPIIGTGRESDGLRRFFAIDGNPETGKDLVPDINPVFDLNSLPEFDYLRNVRRCAARAVSAAGLGLRSWAFLINPANSGVLVVIERIYSQVASTTTMDIALDNAITIAPSGVARVTDSRWGVTSQSAALFGTSQTAATANVLGQLFRYRDVEGMWDTPFILGPNSRVIIQPGADNIAHTCTFIWRERAIHSLEL